MTAPIEASSKTKKVRNQIILFCKIGTSSLNDLTKIINVIINSMPLIDLCENSIISEEVLNCGIISPLHVGHDEPQPSPEPVALTIAPAII
jgi:hypothetical protein